MREVFVIYTCNVCGKKKDSHSVHCRPNGWHGYTTSKDGYRDLCGECYKKEYKKDWDKLSENEKFFLVAIGKSFNKKFEEEYRRGIKR